jgi:thioredoxin-disulfide reductase
MFDTIIIGAGPTGLTAAIYASRRMMKTLIISKNIGGQIIWASEVENYPGFKSIEGPKLAMAMHEQAKNFGVETKVEEIIEIIKKVDSGFIVATNKEKYEAKTIIIAMGLMPKMLELPNEKEFTGKGISYCANCDGQFFKGKTVAVVGGGNAALDAAEVMSKIAKQVYLVYHKSQFKAFEMMVEAVKKLPNVEIMLNNRVVGLIGENKLEKLSIQSCGDLTFRELPVDGLFIEIGHKPKTDVLADLVKRNERGEVIIDSDYQTSQPGIFAAGDVTPGEFKQIIIGCGQGASAALAAYKYLQEKRA